MIPLLISCAREVDIAFTSRFIIAATLEIVQGNFSQATIAKMNFLSDSVHLSYLTLKKPVSKILKNSDMLFFTSLKCTISPLTL